MSTMVTFEEMARYIEQEQLRERIISYGNAVRAHIPPWKETAPSRPAGPCIEIKNINGRTQVFLPFRDLHQRDLRNFILGAADLSNQMLWQCNLEGSSLAWCRDSFKLLRQELEEDASINPEDIPF